MSSHTSVEQLINPAGAAPGTPVRKTTAVNEPLPPAPAGSHVVSISETLLPPPPTPAPKVTTWMSQEGRPTAPQYAQAQPQYTQPQYMQPQYTQQQYTQPQFTPPQQHTYQQYTPPRYAQPQYAPAAVHPQFASLPAPAVRTPTQCPVLAPFPAAAAPVCAPPAFAVPAAPMMMVAAPASLPVVAAAQLQAPQGLQGLVEEMRARVDTTFLLQAQYHLHRHTSNWGR